MRVGAGHGVVPKIQQTRHEAADQGAAALKGPVNRGRQVRGADARLEFQDGEGPGIDRAVEPDHVQGRMTVTEALKSIRAFYHGLAKPFVGRPLELRAFEVAMAI